MTNDQISLSRRQIYDCLWVGTLSSDTCLEIFAINGQVEKFADGLLNTKTPELTTGRGEQDSDLVEDERENFNYDGIKPGNEIPPRDADDLQLQIGSGSDTGRWEYENGPDFPIERWGS